MTEFDKKRFDEIFNSDKYFKHVSNVDMLRSANECNKLYDYLVERLVGRASNDITVYMNFAYWFGVINERQKKGAAK